MGIAQYLNLLQWGAYAAFLALAAALAACGLAGVAVVLLADVRRRLPHTQPPPSHPVWRNPALKEKRPL